jgi:hypothetical protein
LRMPCSCSQSMVSIPIASTSAMRKPNGLPDSSPGFQRTLGHDPKTRFQPRMRLRTRAPGTFATTFGVWPLSCAAAPGFCKPWAGVRKPFRLEKPRLIPLPQSRLISTSIWKQGRSGPAHAPWLSFLTL